MPCTQSGTGLSRKARPSAPSLGNTSIISWLTSLQAWRPSTSAVTSTVDQASNQLSKSADMANQSQQKYMKWASSTKPPIHKSSLPSQLRRLVSCTSFVMSGLKVKCFSCPRFNATLPWWWLWGRDEDGASDRRVCYSCACLGINSSGGWYQRDPPLHIQCPEWAGWKSDHLCQWHGYHHHMPVLCCNAPEGPAWVLGTNSAWCLPPYPWDGCGTWSLTMPCSTLCTQPVVEIPPAIHISWGKMMDKG